MTDGQRQGPLRLQADLDGAEVTIVAHKAPAQAGYVYVRDADGERVAAVPAAQLRLLGFAPR